MTTSYDTDFYVWTQAQAEALRAKDWPALDVANLAEEIESLEGEQVHAVESHVTKDNLLFIQKTNSLKVLYIDPQSHPCPCNY